MATELQRGDIIEINFNPQKGHEQAGWRRAFVLSPRPYNLRSNFVIILPITSQPTKWVYAVPIPKTEGRDTYGAIYVDQIKSFDLSAKKWKYIEPINDEEIIKQVCERAESLVALL